MLALIAFGLLSQTPPTVDQVWKSATDRGFSGGVIVVSSDKTLLFETNNVTKSRPLQLRKNTAFPLCSVTKAFTAELILSLVADGRISLDGTIKQYLSGLPSFADHITIRQLLTHTSGLRNMDAALGVDADGIGAIYHSYDEGLKDLRARVLKIVGEAATAGPGAKYDYNNSDFLVLQLIAEQVSHQTYTELLQARVFSPASMKRTHLAKWDRNDTSYVRCFRTAPTGDVPLAPFNMAIYGGAAGLISTPDDLARWMKFTLTSPIGQRLLTAGSQYGGFQGFGGYAIQTDALSKGHPEPAFERPGAVNAYALQVSFLPERHLAIAVFSNRENERLGSMFEGKGLAFELAAAASRQSK